MRPRARVGREGCGGTMEVPWVFGPGGSNRGERSNSIPSGPGSATVANDTWRMTGRDWPGVLAVDGDGGLH